MEASRLVSVRMPQCLVDRIDEAAAVVGAGIGYGVDLSRSQVTRWLLEEGLRVLEARGRRAAGNGRGREKPDRK
jgi:hypothetical protein